MKDVLWWTSVMVMFIFVILASPFMTAAMVFATLAGIIVLPAYLLIWFCEWLER
jgi:hypothetical protein